MCDEDAQGPIGVWNSLCTCESVAARAYLLKATSRQAIDNECGISPLTEHWRPPGFGISWPFATMSQNYRRKRSRSGGKAQVAGNVDWIGHHEPRLVSLARKSTG